MSSEALRAAGYVEEVEPVSPTAHERIAAALERIADALERQAPPVANPPHVFGAGTASVDPQRIRNY